MKTLRLMVLLPPHDSEMKVLNLRSYIFSQYGYASALALPAMIPLFPVPIDLPLGVIKKALKSHPFPGFSMTASKLVDISSALYLKIEEDKALLNLITRCHDIFLPLSHDQNNINKKESFLCFPFFTGFFLAQNERNIDKQEIKLSIPDFPVLNVKHFIIALLIVHIYSGFEKWWENIDWEIPLQVKSKK